MASILRSGKVFRYFAGLTRNLVANRTQDTDHGAILRNSTCICSQVSYRFASNPAPKVSDPTDLDKQLRQLDQDVRRFGRISRRDIEEILEEIRQQRSATSSQSLMVIRCCGNLVPEEMPEVRTALVQEIWKTLNALNVPMDISHYNALLRVYLENEHPFSPTDFLAEIESKSLECNRVTYQRLIARFCQQGDIDGATRILEYMREKKLPVNEHVFNSLILGHSQANDLESAVGVLSMMKQAGLEPSADSYSILLCCYARHGRMEELLKTLEECEQKEIVLLDKDILEVIYTLAINGHVDKLDDLLGKLKLSAGFNQDAVNVILRLVNKGHEDVGLKILRKMPRGTRPDGQPVDAGFFFIKQLVKANRPVEKILSICKTMQEEGLNPKALQIATETGLTNGLVNHTLPLLKEMKKTGLPIRQHYFWPIICAVESDRIFDIIRHMQDEFSMNVSSETLREYVLPNLREKNYEKIISSLRDVGIPTGTAAVAAAYSALSSNQMKEAAKIMESYRAIYNAGLFRQILLTAFSKTHDVDALVRAIRQIYEHSLVKKSPTEAQDESNEVETEEATSETTDSNQNNNLGFIGSFLMDLTAYFRRERVEVLEKVLPKLVSQGISINSSSALAISDRLGSDMTPLISEMLGKMSSGDLTLVSQNKNVRKRGLDELTIEELERFITNVEAKGENANNIKRHLINACFRTKDLDKTIQTIDKLKEENFSIPTGVSAQLVDLYVHHEKSSEAMELFNKLQKENPEFRLDNLKTVHFIDLLLKEDRFEDAIDFLNRNKKGQPFAEGEGSFNYMSTVWRILNSLAEKGESTKLQKIFESLVAGNYVTPSNIILGPLIKVHLVKDDIKTALDTFEKICQQYNSTPWKNELACRLIQKEDASNLQRLTDLSTNIHGEVNSLYDLVFAFVECGRIRQARKILETPGLRTRLHRISNACERYKNEGLIEPLEGLMEATKDLTHIDRSNICYNLLQSYTKTEDADKALSLWTKMQEENITPSDAFLLLLAELLKSKGQPIPFAVPQNNQINPKTESKAKPQGKALKSQEIKSEQTTSRSKVSSNMSLMRRAINAGNLDAAIEYKNQLTANEKPRFNDLSNLIEKLVQAGRLTEATKYVDELLSEQHFPQPKVFKFFLNKVASAGDIKTIQNIGEKLNDDMKRMVSYDNRLCHAVIIAGKVDQYLKDMKEEISAAKTSEEVATLAAKFPRGGALGILEKHPEKLSQFEEIAELYAKHNQLGPVNVLWMHHISHDNEKASKEIWNKYLSNAPRLMFQRVLQTARDQSNDQLAQTIVNQLRDSKISEGAIGNAYSCLIDILLSKGNPDKALEVLKNAVKDVCLENINRTALLRLRTTLEEQNKQFPYTIPEKKQNKRDMSSSSSSSDDEAESPETKSAPAKNN